MNRRWRAWRDWVWITLGTAIAASGINAFYAPNRISDGGVSGVGILLFDTVGVPIWVTLTAINLPLLWLSHRLWGARVGLRTVYGTLMLSLFVAILTFHPWTHDLLLSAVYGGLSSGVGLGLVFRARGTTGGTDVVARMLSRALPISMGQAMMSVDFFIIASLGVIFGPRMAMYSLIALFISSRAIDAVQEGIGYARAFTVISQEAEKIEPRIIGELGRGVTRLSGRGAYSGQEKTVLYVVVNRSEVTRLKDLIYSVDPRAFVVVGSVHEVVGEGFQSPPSEEEGG